MRTFKRVKAFGSGITGATGGLSNEALLFLNAAGASRTITIQSKDPNGNLVPVGPFTLVNNQTFIYPIYAHGWTGSAGGTLNAWELF
jgi:hypothetical protein